MSQSGIRLSELNNWIKESLSGEFRSPLWVIGEIAGYSERNGSCFFDLVEKSESGDQIVAQLAGRIWANSFRMLKPYFETTTQQRLGTGVKVLLQVRIQFHELYGLSMQVVDIDPTYTLGDLARRRMEVIKRLTDEGVIGMNKELQLPLVPQNIAVISSSAAAGYEDFVKHLRENAAGYSFNIRLFDALMQGNQAENSIISALDQVYQWEEYFDLVVLIRGGGSQTDLSCFDSYNLAYHITQFPLPVLTGIGHEKDESIADMVAHTRLKTPTAVADFLINALEEFENHILTSQQQVIDRVGEILEEAGDKLELTGKEFISAVRKRLVAENQLLLGQQWRNRHAATQQLSASRTSLNNLSALLMQRVGRKTTGASERLKSLSGQLSSLVTRTVKNNEVALNEKEMIVRRMVNQIIRNHSHILEIADQKARLMDPLKVLERGYSITTCNGKLVKSAALLSEGELLETRLAEGLVTSLVKSIKTDSK